MSPELGAGSSHRRSLSPRREWRCFPGALDQSDWGSPVKKQHQITSHEGTEWGRMVLGFLNHPSTTRTYSHCKRFQMVRNTSVKKGALLLTLSVFVGLSRCILGVRAHTNEPLQGQYLPRESPGREGPAPPTQVGAPVTVARAAFPILSKDCRVIQ